MQPRLYVLADGYPRALSAGRGAGGGAGLALSVGLLGVASPAELEGIVAHELAHLRNRDVLVQTVVVIVALSIVELSRIGGFLQRALLFVLGADRGVVRAPAAFARSGSSRPTALRPSSATRRTGSPTRCCGSSRRWSSSRSRRAPPPSRSTRRIRSPSEGLGALFDSHPPVGERVRRLRELDPDWREKLVAASLNRNELCRLAVLCGHAQIDERHSGSSS